MLFTNRFAQRLKEQREARHLTQAQLAERLGVDVRTIRRWEAGERSPGPYALLKLVKELDLSLPTFIDLSCSIDLLKRRKTVPLGPEKPEHPNTYLVPNSSSDDENVRLHTQALFLTAAIGGLLPERDNPEQFHRILDVGCGAGVWLIELAKLYPTMELIGIDLSASRIQYARDLADKAGVAERVRFEVMDALATLRFANETFDLVNLRAASSFVRFWEWGQIIMELQRVLKKEGTLRMTEVHLIRSSSPALNQLCALALQATIQAGYAINSETDSVPRRLQQIFTAIGFHAVQNALYEPVYRAGTPEGLFFAEDITHVFKVIVPFLQHWVHVPDDYEQLYQQILIDVNGPGFEAAWPIETIWGIK